LQVGPSSTYLIVSLNVESVSCPRERKSLYNGSLLSKDSFFISPMEDP